jgi:putative pyoverdin transport system ATP-binding/permease protein
MKIISFLLRQSRGVFLFAVIAGVVSGVAGAALLSLVNRALNEEGADLTLLGWAFAGLCILLALTRVSSHLLLVRLGEEAVLKIRLELVRRVLGTPLAKLEEIGEHRVLAALTEDTTAIANALVLLPTIGINLLIVVCSLVYLGWLSVQVLLGFLLVMSVAGTSYVIPVRLAMRRYRRAREEQDGLFKQFRFLTEGSKELKLHAARRNAFFAKVERIAQSLRDLYVSGATVAGIGHAWGQLLVFFAVGCLIFVLPQIQTISRETLTGYTLVLFYVMSPFQLILQMLPLLGRGGVALNRVEKLGLSLDPPPGGSGGEALSVATPRSWRHLELSGVTYGYHGNGGEAGFAVGPIDLVLQPGEIVVVVGGNGSGKTTLAKIISGLYPPEAGEIRLDGQPVTGQTADRYRQLFSTVFSDFCLFESLLGLEGPDLDQQAHRYLVKLDLDRKVTVKEGELSTVSLSQGQRKRLALLTAYLEDRPIYIFDEWAADQDPMFKQVFYHQLLPELKSRGKTVLVISHDDRYFGVADRLVRLEEGRLEREEIVSRVLA